MGVDAVVTKNVSVSSVHYEAKGTLDAVLKSVATIFVNYDPRGYSTRVEAIFMSSDGTYVGRMSRSHSCD